MVTAGNMSKVIAVYGSLKMGRYNHPLIQGSQFLGESKIKGTMYSLGSYPALVEEGNKEYTVELYQVPTMTHERVRNMELGAGYKEKELEFEHAENYEFSKKLLKTKAVIYYADDFLAEYCKGGKEVIDNY